MMQNSKTYFNPWETIYEGNPQEILERGEKVTLPPLLIMQGELDDNVRPAVQEKFAAPTAPRAASASMKCSRAASIYGREPGPQTDRAHEMVKAFIARQLRAKRLAA